VKSILNVLQFEMKLSLRLKTVTRLPVLNLCGLLLWVRLVPSVRRELCPSMLLLLLSLRVPVSRHITLRIRRCAQGSHSSPFDTPLKMRPLYNPVIMVQKASMMLACSERPADRRLNACPLIAGDGVMIELVYVVYEVTVQSLLEQAAYGCSLCSVHGNPQFRVRTSSYSYPVRVASTSDL